MNLKNISIGDIVSIPAFNASRMGLTPSEDFHVYFRDDKDRASLASKLYNGWNPSLGVMLLTPVTDLNRDDAILARQRELKAYESYNTDRVFKLSVGDGGRDSNITVNAMDVRNWAFANLSKTPKFIAVTCNRRDCTMPVVNAARIKNGLEPITTIECQIKSYDSGDPSKDALNRELDGLVENLDKTEGQWSMSLVNLLAAVWSVFTLGARERDLQDTIAHFRGTAGRGRVQKHFLACRVRRAVFNACKAIQKIDPDYPMIDTFAACLEGKWSFAPYEGETAKLTRHMLTDENDIIGNPEDVIVNDDGSKTEMPNLTGLLAIVQGGKKSNEKKMAARDKITAVIGSTENAIVKYILKATKDDDLGSLAKLNHLNAVSEKLLSATPDQMNAIAQLLS